MNSQRLLSKFRLPLLIGIIALAIIIVAGATVLFILPTFSSTNETQGKNIAFAYIKDGNDYVEYLGKKTLLTGATLDYPDYIGSTKYEMPIAAYNDKSQKLIYLKDFDSNTSTGQLNELNLNEEKPVASPIGDNVGVVEIANNGSLLYIANISDHTGDLYYKSNTSSAALVSRNVYINNFGFSENSQHFYYLTIDDYSAKPDVYTANLFIKFASNSQSNKVDTFETAKDDFYYRKFFITNDADIFFSLNNLENEYTNLSIFSESRTLYRIPYNGPKEKLSVNGEILNIDKDGGVFYTNDDDVFYKAAGKDKTRICQNYYYTNNFAWNDDGHIIIVEKNGDSDYSLYECNKDNEKVLIAKNDGISFRANDDLSSVIFRKGDAIYIANKGGQEWKYSEKIDDTPYNTHLDFVGNKKAAYIKYSKLSEKGDLCVWDMNSSKTEVVLYDATNFHIIDSRLYAVNEDKEVFDVTDSKNKIKITDQYEDYYSLKDGVYIIRKDKDYALGFLGRDGKYVDIEQNIQSKPQGVPIRIPYIEPKPDVPQDIVEFLSQSDNEAKIYYNILKGDSDKNTTSITMTIEDRIEQFKSMETRNDIPDEVSSVIDCYYLGFLNVDLFKLSTDLKQYDKTQQYFDNALKYFDEAFIAYDGLADIYPALFE